jgi:hypothetical protein
LLAANQTNLAIVLTNKQQPKATCLSFCFRNNNIFVALAEKLLLLKKTELRRYCCFLKKEKRQVALLLVDFLFSSLQGIAQIHPIFVSCSIPH